MLARLPFASHTAIYAAAVEIWAQLGPEDYREAFGHHPEIGFEFRTNCAKNSAKPRIGPWPSRAPR